MAALYDWNHHRHVSPPPSVSRKQIIDRAISEIVQALKPLTNSQAKAVLNAAAALVALDAELP